MIEGTEAGIYIVHMDRLKQALNDVAGLGDRTTNWAFNKWNRPQACIPLLLTNELYRK